MMIHVALELSTSPEIGVMLSTRMTWPSSEYSIPLLHPYEPRRIG
jgi:hypothetical protein